MCVDEQHKKKTHTASSLLQELVDLSCKMLDAHRKKVFACDRLKTHCMDFGVHPLQASWLHCTAATHTHAHKHPSAFVII